MLSAASLYYKRRLEILRPGERQPIIIDSAAVSYTESIFLGYVSDSTLGPENHYISSLRRNIHSENVQQHSDTGTDNQVMIASMEEADISSTPRPNNEGRLYMPIYTRLLARKAEVQILKNVQT